MGRDCVASLCLGWQLSRGEQCAVRGQGAQLCLLPAVWSTYRLCRWEEPGAGPEEKAEGEAVSREEGQGKGEEGKSGWTLGVLLFVVLTLCTIVMAFILGRVAV